MVKRTKAEPRINTNRHEIVFFRGETLPGRQPGAAAGSVASLIMHAASDACASYGAAVLHIVERSETMLHAVQLHRASCWKPGEVLFIVQPQEFAVDVLPARFQGGIGIGDRHGFQFGIFVS